MEAFKDASLLILDDSRDVCETLGDVLARVGFFVEGFTESAPALQQLREKFYHIILLDVYLKGTSGLDLLQDISLLSPASKVIMITGYGSKEVAIEALRKGAFDFLEKPVATDMLFCSLRRALMVQKVELEREKLFDELRQTRDDLLHRERKLKKLNEQLMEANRALIAMARNMEIAKKETQRNMVRRIKLFIIPVVEEMKANEHMKRRESKLAILLEYFKELVLALESESGPIDSLSPCEMKIAYLVRTGLTTDEISKVLHIAPSTVKTHRKNIRKKLNICNTSHNLKSYLEKKMHREL